LRGFNKTLAEDDYMAQQADVLEGERARTALPDMPIYTNTIATSQLPSYVNWTNTSWVGPIQNQGQCGSCWTFSAAGALEAQYYNKTGTFVTMSEQNLVDCTYYLGNLGCSGGNVELAFDYVMNVGIDTYASYPYTGRANNGVCKYNANNSVTQDVGWRLIPEGNELALQQAVALTGPVSVAIDASLSSFDSYAGGVYSPVNCSTTELDHAVLVVGYGTYEGQDYWLIKNSWGTDWGIYGYMMMERGVNMCGIATSALFPVID
jgi:cathepsin L